jgi:hypothetical protein
MIVFEIMEPAQTLLHRAGRRARKQEATAIPELVCLEPPSHKLTRAPAPGSPATSTRRWGGVSGDLEGSKQGIVILESPQELIRK